MGVLMAFVRSASLLLPLSPSLSLFAPPRLQCPADQRHERGCSEAGKTGKMLSPSPNARARAIDARRGTRASEKFECVRLSINLRSHSFSPLPPSFVSHPRCSLAQADGAPLKASAMEVDAPAKGGSGAEGVTTTATAATVSADAATNRPRSAAAAAPRRRAAGP